MVMGPGEGNNGHNGLPLLSTLFLRMVRNGLLSYVGTWGPLKKAPIGGTGMDSYGAGSEGVWEALSAPPPIRSYVPG